MAARNSARFRIAPAAWTRPALSGAVALLLAGCAREPTRAPAPAPAAKPEQPKAVPRFTTLRVTTPTAMIALERELGRARFQEILRFNRIDVRHLRQGDEIMLPHASLDWMALAPFPEAWQEAGEQEKLLAVSLRLQAWAAYEQGRLVRWGPVSTGRKASPTPPGFYHTNWRQAERRSTFNGEWQLKWYVNLHNRSGISLHQYDLPGYPDSHACVRLAPEDAEWIYRWCRSWVLTPDERTVVQEGTPVVVFGAYGWGRPRPWKRVAEDPEASRLGAEELGEALRILRDRVVPEFPPGEVPVP